MTEKGKSGSFCNLMQFPHDYKSKRKVISGNKSTYTTNTVFSSTHTLQDSLIQSQFQTCSVKHLSLIGIPCDQSIDLHCFVLTNPVASGLSLWERREKGSQNAGLPRNNILIFKKTCFCCSPIQKQEHELKRSQHTVKQADATTLQHFPYCEQFYKHSVARRMQMNGLG